MSGNSLVGRVALVTGGAQGLGAGVAAALTAAGAKVLIADISDDAGKETAAGLDGGAYVHLDVTDDAGWEAATAAAVSELGGLDIVVNNAGIEVTHLIADSNPEEIRKMLDINILGTLLGVKHAFRAMRPDGAAGKGGTVINVASVSASIAFPGIAGYSATKSAVDRLTRVAAAESAALGYGVRVATIFPGLVPTAMGMKLAVETAGSGSSKMRTRRSPESSDSLPPGASAPSRTSLTVSSSSPPMPPNSSTAAVCTSTAASATDSDFAAPEQLSASIPSTIFER